MLVQATRPDKKSPSKKTVCTVQSGVDLRFGRGTAQTFAKLMGGGGFKAWGVDGWVGGEKGLVIGWVGGIRQTWMGSDFYVTSSVALLS